MANVEERYMLEVSTHASAVWSSIDLYLLIGTVPRLDTYRQSGARHEQNFSNHRRITGPKDGYSLMESPRCCTTPQDKDIDCRQSFLPRGCSSLKDLLAMVEFNICSESGMAMKCALFWHFATCCSGARQTHSTACLLKRVHLAFI